jgi:integrase
VRERHWFRLDGIRTEAEARGRALQLGALAREGRLSPPAEALPTAKARPWDEIPDRTAGGLETVKGWTLRWLAERRRRGLKSVRADEARLRTWIWPRLGAIAMVHVQREQIETVVEWLDEKVREKKLAWKTALNVWTVLSKLFQDSAYGKPRELRVRATQGDPTERVAPPDRGARKGKQFLYPSELERLLRCDEVPLAVRQVYAVAVYLYPREGELEALDCDDVDLVHGTVLIHRARQESGEIRETKGNRPRRIPIHPHLWPLLTHLVALAGGKGLLWPEFPCWKDRAGQLRKYLARAGVDRVELLEGSPTSKVMGFHDLRATGITWEVLAGTDPLKIQQRAGHTSLNTTLIYVRLADEVRGVRFGVPLGPLPECLVPRTGNSVGYSGLPSSPQKAERPAADRWFGVRDSNPWEARRHPPRARKRRHMHAPTMHRSGSLRGSQGLPGQSQGHWWKQPSGPPSWPSSRPVT